MTGRGGSLLLAGVLLLLAGVSARMLLLAREEAALAARAAGRGDSEAQARHLRRAMAHYLPGNPWVGAACRDLAALAARQEARGDRDGALATHRELRSAILVLRTGWQQPFSGELAVANARIAALVPRHRDSDRSSPAPTPAGGVARRSLATSQLPPRSYPADAGARRAIDRSPGGEALTGGAPTLERLSNPPDPEIGWVLLALAGFILWVAAAVLMLLRGLKPDLSLIPGRFWPLLGAVALGWAMFAVGLGLA